MGMEMEMAGMSTSNPQSPTFDTDGPPSQQASLFAPFISLLTSHRTASSSPLAPSPFS